MTDSAAPERSGLHDRIGKVTVDASVGISWLLDEVRPPWVDELFAAVADGSMVGTAPSLLWLEVGNRLAGDQMLTDEQALDGILRLEAVGLETIDMDSSLRLLALTQARESGLTMYDATYLALARTLQAPLATLDVRLEEVSAAQGWSYRAPPDRGDSQERIPEAHAGYGEGVRDHTSLAAIGATLADMRRQYEAS